MGLTCTSAGGPLHVGRTLPPVQRCKHSCLAGEVGGGCLQSRTGRAEMGSVLTGQAACRDRCAQAAARVALYSGAPLAAGRGRQRPTTPAGFYAFIARGHNNYAREFYIDQKPSFFFFVF